MISIATTIALLAVATGDLTGTNPSPGEVRRGPLVASLTVSPSETPRVEVVLHVALRNVSGRTQSFRLERPAVEFFVKDGRGAVVHASVPCLQGRPCDAGLPEATHLEPGGRLDFEERWSPRSGHLPAGHYTVKARLRVYGIRRPDGTESEGDVTGFTLVTDLRVP